MDAFQDKEVGKGREGEICGFHEHLRFETIPWLCQGSNRPISCLQRAKPMLFGTVHETWDLLY